MKEETGGFAFPWQTSFANYPGMTLRDYFAAKALAALIPVCATHEARDREERMNYVVEASWKFADKMMKARDNVPS